MTVWRNASKGVRLLTLQHAFFRTTYRKLQAKQLGNNFRAVTEIVEAKYDDLVKTMLPNSIITKNHYVAINASDVNFTNGKYTPDVKP